jgi:membrane-associated phospholipid phosphatase
VNKAANVLSGGAVTITRGLRRPKSSALRRAALGAVVVGVLAPVVRKRLNVPKPVTTVLAWQAPLALAVALPRTRARDAGIYALQMWAYIAHYEMPNDDPEALMRRLRVDYPIRVDRALGLGQAPTIRLQRALGRPGHVRPHDTLLSTVHWSWFLVPHGSMAYLLVFRHDHFVRGAVMMAATFDLGCVVYWLLPTAPPWWAGDAGKLPHVRRIMTEAGEKFWGRAWQRLYDSLAGNPFAAMPSLHFGTSVMAAYVLSDVSRRHGAVGWTYALTLGFGLVYLGEHYVCDLLAGFALAYGVRRLEQVAWPALQRAQLVFQRLEPGAA